MESLGLKCFASMNTMSKSMPVQIPLMNLITRLPFDPHHSYELADHPGQASPVSSVTLILSLEAGSIERIVPETCTTCSFMPTNFAVAPCSSVLNARKRSAAVTDSLTGIESAEATPLLNSFQAKTPPPTMAMVARRRSLSLVS